MPLYEYQCDSCGTRFERIQKFSDPPVTECPKCGGHVQKLLSSPAIQFKGTGWYITDYARKSESGKDTKKSKDARDSKDSAGSTSSSDSTPSSSDASSSGSTTSTPSTPASGPDKPKS